MGYYFYFPPENKFVVATYAEFLEKNLLSQEISGSAEELEKIQDEDTSPSENTSEIPLEVQGFKPPQEGVVPIRRSARTHRAPNSLCLNVKVEEHSLRDLNEHSNYKAAILDPESDKWVDAMNVEMQSVQDNQVWCLVDLRPNWVDYEETFSLVADIRAIRILIAIMAFYDYEIWKMDVKTAFLNGYLDKDIYIYMVQPEGFVDPNHPRQRYRMNNSKRSYILVQEKLDLNKTQGASTPEEVKRMQNVPYPSAVGSIMLRLRFKWRGSRLEELEQSTNTMSATESEHIVALEPGMEAVWIRKFILGLGIVPTINEPIKMFCENSAALHFANEPVVQKGARH
nr:hypothetical protein [Tanacetum cinerariifolium]